MKKLFVFALVGATVQIANASYLYWQVSLTDISGAQSRVEENWSDWATSWGETAINAAKIYVTDGSSHTEAQTILLNGTAVSMYDGTTAKVPDNTPYSINLSEIPGASSYSYFVEIGNWDGSTYHAYAKSASVAYRDLSDSISETLSQGAAVIPWHATSYSAVPEPTSAILMLFGAAFLGLKRKNRSLA